MKISVVVPTYRRPALLLRCVEALLQQSFPTTEYEIIVVSDGPDEKTKRVLEERVVSGTPLIRFYFLQAKRGPAAARNYGWRQSRSRLIAFTDDDCIPDKKWLASLWNRFLRTSGSKFAFRGNTLVPIPEVPTDYERNIARLASAEFITANCACTKAALEKVGGFDERFSMAWREDSDLYFKFLQQNIPVIRVEQAIVTHPVRRAPWGISIREEKKGVFNALLYKKFPSLYKEKIRSGTPWHYYAVTGCVALLAIGVLSFSPKLIACSLAAWIFLTAVFAMRRLSNTSHSFRHISEMVVTSAIIPVLSLYWRWYGSWKYGVFLY